MPVCNHHEDICPESKTQDVCTKSVCEIIVTKNDQRKNTLKNSVEISLGC